MNRHERRKQKKNIRLNQTINQDLLHGIKLHTNKKYKEAESLYNKVLITEPKNYEALRHLGILNQDLERYENAYNYFLQALKINPNGFQALSNLATIHMENKNYELAYRCLKQSLTINPNYIPTINNLAGYYHKINDPKNAIYYSEMAIRFQPNNPIALVQHAKALIINGQPEEAIILLEKLNKDFPDNDNFKQNLSTAYREIGEFKKANKISVIGFKKDYKNIAYLLGITKGKDNKLQEEQIEYYNQLLERENIKLEDKALICHSFLNILKIRKIMTKPDPI